MSFDDGSGKAEKASVDVRLQKDSLVWLSIRTATGIEGVRALAETDTIRIALKVAKPRQALVSSFQSLSEQTGFAMQVGWLQSVFTANLPADWQPKSRPEKEENHFVFRQEADGYRIVLKVGRISGRPELVEVYHLPTANQLRLTYAEYELVDGQYFPMLIRAVLNVVKDGQPKEYALELDLNKVKQEQPDLSFPFFIPSRYEINPLQLR